MQAESNGGTPRTPSLSAGMRPSTTVSVLGYTFFGTVIATRAESICNPNDDVRFGFELMRHGRWAVKNGGENSASSSVDKE